MRVVGRYTFRKDAEVLKSYGILKIGVDRGLNSYRIYINEGDYTLTLPTMGGYSQSELVLVLSHLAFFIQREGKEKLAEFIAKKASLIRMEGV